GDALQRLLIGIRVGLCDSATSLGDQVAINERVLGGDLGGGQASHLEADLPRFEYHHRFAGLTQCQRRAESGNAGADYGYVTFAMAGEGWEVDFRSGSGPAAAGFGRERAHGLFLVSTETGSRVENPPHRTVQPFGPLVKAHATRQTPRQIT